MKETNGPQLTEAQREERYLARPAAAAVTVDCDLGILKVKRTEQPPTWDAQTSSWTPGRASWEVKATGLGEGLLRLADHLLSARKTPSRARKGKKA